ncbi:DUF2946 domain-containing protein [Duganella sp. CF458]|uniref:DUF2946 domain-containing protein n=1 Tax=Duganella sp. CF458 TaxID=1884368 RepID=UPI000B82EC16|nr:DUF2946 domain-containing protein [Duganella sp. CF458]
MNRNSRLHRFTAWLACLAMVFAVLAPSISRAQSGDGWIEICTTGGMKLVKITDADSSQKPSGSLIHGEHCPFCATHTDIAGPIPASPIVIHPAGLVSAVPRLFLQVPRTLFTWAPAQSRAPPAAA